MPRSTPRTVARRASLRVLGTLGLLTLVAVSGCAVPTTPTIDTVRVAVPEALTSYNAESSYGRATSVNGDVALLTGGVFGWTEADGTVTLDSRFGTAEIVQAEPFIVRYAIAAGVEWSDGVPVSSTDLLLAWAANSGALNDPDADPAAALDADTGRLTGAIDGVYFDGRLTGGIALARATPQVVDDRTLLVRYESRFPDWALALEPGIPAHVLARRAGVAAAGDEDATADAALVRTAIETRDPLVLSALAQSWNSDFDLTAEGVTAPPSAGPYLVDGVDGERVELRANPAYSGGRTAETEIVTLIPSADPLGTLDLLASDQVDIADLPATADLATQLDSLPDIEARVGLSARAEHLDLRITGGRSGVFSNARLREAFLLTVPRAEIADALSGALDPGLGTLDSFTIRQTDPAYPDVIGANGSAAYAAPDLDRARELVVDSGVSAPEVCILFDPNDSARRASFELIAASAAEAGFRVSDCSRPSWDEFLGVDGVYDAALFAWDTSRLGRAGIARVFRSDAAVANLTGYADPAADALIDELAVTDDPERATALLSELDGLLWAASYGVPLATWPTLTAVRDGWDAVERSPLEHGLVGRAWQWHPAE